MVQVVSPSKGCIEIDGLSGRRYRANDGIFNMSPGDAEATVKFGGSYRNLMGSVKANLGSRCLDCGFGCWFKPCGRCGSENVKRGA